jgi:oligoendopeptidase F
MTRSPALHAAAVHAPDGTASAAAADIPTWNLADLYASPQDPAIAADLAETQTRAKAYRARFHGRIASLSAADLAQAIADYEQIEERLGRISSFAQLLFSADSTDAATGQFYQMISEQVTQIGSDLLFLPLEINRIDDSAVAAMLAEPALARWAPWLRDLLVFRPHQLSDEAEKLFHEKDVTGHAAWSRLFDETMAGMRVAIGSEELTLSAALNRLSDRDRAVRQQAGIAIGAALKKHEKLLALITNILAKDKEISDNWRGYPTPGSARNRGNMVEDEVVAALVAAVTDAYPALSHRYYAMKAKWLGLAKLQHWDRNAPLPEDDDRAVSWLQARAKVLDSYSQFSPELASIADIFFDRNWIDATPRPGKSGGAFAHPTVPSAHPYVLMNFHGRTRDVMTLAHELGHGVHQVLASRQGYLMSGTPLTLAETASVFGEMLTFRALLDAETDPRRRRVMLAQKIEDMLNTVVRQIAFYQFETAIHNERRRGELLPERISEIWLDVQRTSLGPAFEFTDEYRMFWAYVPHFIHSPFYVYAYAFGDCLVNALYGVFQDAKARGDEAGFITNYMQMLRAGGTKRHRELLAPFGLDASDPQFWRRGLDVISGFIDELAE